MTIRCCLVPSFDSLIFPFLHSVFILRQLTAAHLLEQHIQKQILDYLRLRGIPRYKHQNFGLRKPDGGYIPTHTRGVSDIIGCIPKTGRFLAIEVKPTGEQQQFIDTINEAGGLAFVARSVEDVASILSI